ncbi:inositol 2-dehydrogenase [Acidisoma cellulosilytica]|uniref:Inositol 2-dehydrogenase n=1 Tax=Acidisoma cellulosilyticum TaxID=2802395 RepID=A0A963YZF0_9PROT|nr:inositol 2-dehydrogenase [Acidisoma cellulosilyticum]MCB8879904.1 inositol 2-dehydrogenase [Acidisoma cellulosilyticum]
MIRFSVLGCGRIGTMHARNLARHPQAQLVSVFDVFTKASDAMAAELGVRAAQSVDEVLADSEVDAVLIATSTDTHVELITRAARAGKAILCEKPIALDMEKVKACWAEISALNATVMIGFNRRFDPSFRAVHDRMTAGEIGKLEQLIITSRDPGPPPISYINVSGGLFRDMTIHDFDLARYFAGDIVEVQAFGGNLVDPAIKAAGDIDAAMVTMRSASGVLIHINNSRRASYGYDQRLEAFGEKGMLIAGNKTATSVQSFSAAGTAQGDVVLPFFIERYADAYAAEIGNFVESVAAGKTPLTSFRDGAEALRLADAALESFNTGRVVKLG